MENNSFRPDYLFEVSWEICNKVGGIHTAISSRARLVSEKFNDNYILIGPDVWKETRNNPEFTEEPYMFRAWKRFAESSGIKVKTGRWNIPGNPIVILVDFTPLFSQKDKIFYDYWEKYQLDSITGQWLYVEPALFGHAAAQVIENFYQFNLTAKHSLVVHFHDWTTGTGILYLKNSVPQASTVYTAYATNVGRTMASQQQKKFGPEQNAVEESNKLGVRARHSLESLAVKYADTFTTLSQELQEECSLILDRKADFIIPNGIDFNNLPNEATYNEKRIKARNKIQNVAEALTNRSVDKDSLFILHSGLYDFQNKGTDVFIKSLSNLNHESKKDIVAVICLPGNQTGPKAQVIERIHNCDYSQPVTHEILTHNLKDELNDPVIIALREAGLQNLTEDKVKVIFVPTYLNGEDGIFNIVYHDLLPGFDLTVLPSFYDSWSHTPMESISLSVPTITSDLTGFARYLEQINKGNESVMIIKRSTLNTEETIKEITQQILHFSELSPDKQNEIRKMAFETSHLFNWENFLTNYCSAYEAAENLAQTRYELFKNKKIAETFIQAETGLKKMPVWKKVFIKSYIPERLYPLQIIAKNIWWSWNYDAQELYEIIDPVLWGEVNRNPILMLESLTVSKFAELEKNTSFLEKLDNVYARFNEYMNTPTPDAENKIAYFSMEYGLHDSIKIYSGGLGVLAGDYLKEASDSNKPIVAIGLLYRYGYFTQSLSIHGEQQSNYIPQKFTNLPLLPVRDDKNDWVLISFGFPGRTVYAKVWKLMVGRVPLFLLDTDIPENNEQDRSITHQLYGGDWENRLKQEIILGIGGVKLLRTLDIHPSIYHCNEGHAALLSLERLKLLVEKHLYSFNEAVEIVRATTLFTTHTPVPAGHDAFTEDLIRTYLSHYAEKINIDWNKLVGLGRVYENDSFEKFSMSVLAAKLSGEINGVSRIHGKVTREMFNNIW
ncbi:MAG: alpha-glucan family phosphorylase, partial [Bacteroidetes bacterium HGW-Bacteroidetes-21]